MKLKKIVAIGLMLMTLTGCSAVNNQEIDALNEKVVQLQEKNETLQESIQSLEEQVKNLSNENNALLLEIEGLTKKEYTIYTRDVDSWEITEVEKVKIDYNLSLQEKLQILADNLSQSQFKGLPIEVKGIEKINGDEIAIINLKDDPKQETTWQNSYFQGSTGGAITTTTLEETFLQRENNEKWVDGIKVLYNDKKLVEEHITLGNIIYR